MNILILEPFLTGSHAAWAREYAARSSHRVEVLGLAGHYWKWRMHGGAVTLARKFLEADLRPDLLLATDMLDLTTFLALTRKRTAGLPTALYFHENQLSYPWSPTDRDPGQERDMHYCFINYASALAADAVLFNSGFHLESFHGELPGFLQSFPDCNEAQSSAAIRAKSQVLPLGLDLARLDEFRPPEAMQGQRPLILWNHRWEYDKNPEEFFRALFLLAARGLEFEVAVLGESYRRAPAIFAEARRRLGERIVQFGYARDFGEYAGWLWRADILPVTSIHDFFGVSVVQAMYCGCRPLLPRRLAYPEHLPPAEQGLCFYEGFEDLVARLEKLLGDGCRKRESGTGAYVARYDWGRLAPVYDRVLAGIAGCGKAGREG
ncbi:glycosyl transferase family 1 [Desulfuromonas versatilis]|uniref:tRNA-queuosine alpha-mannosyltransferase n=1 Tax=Desulfuromonas versatilis TaxID=2802975 RepID=A0ABM8HPP2_9BACT|nr:DUF3524 domain-containing protein [Desulfuromonas versatilis]BCR03629.1 glycosyl transferase family 1 [Desulfuromonas versatilis]